MRLASAKVGPFKSISKPQDVKIDADVTVLVGLNEAGKTVFLRALEKARDAFAVAKYDVVDDYPRKDLTPYQKVHETQPAVVVEATYELAAAEVELVNSRLGISIKTPFGFTVIHKYNNASNIDLKVEEGPVVAGLANAAGLSTETKAAIAACKSVRAIPDALAGVEMTDPDKQHLEAIKTRIAATPKEWQVVQHELWRLLEPRVPRFVYFDEYQILPSETNLKDLRTRRDAANADPKRLRPEDRAVLALLRMADVSLDDFGQQSGYEPLRAKLEAVSISLTDQVMEFWKANESNLEVMIDIHDDPAAAAPFNDGPNLYLRIRNIRHRGVSTPFRQRSKGFIWFFSFLVWFDDVRHQVDEKSKDAALVLLLDEPGLSLHAMAQRDFLAYIDVLAEKHQVIYTTHSPFMVHSDRLRQVRVVEDQDGVGTVLSDNVSSSNDRTTFPLQAALGYTIAQNLFISKRNFLVEGSSELIFVQAFSALLEQAGRVGLREDVTIVPVGGMGNLVTFIALLGASGLKLAVLHDYRGKAEQKLVDLVREKLIAAKAVLDVSQFRDLAKIGTSGLASDIEDMFEPAEYLGHFNAAFAKELKSPLKPAELPAGDRILDRLERALEARGEKLRPSGGFNHYTVASHFSGAPGTPANDTLKRFEELFKKVNALVQ